MSERKKDDLDQTDATLERLEQEVQCKEEQSGDKPNSTMVRWFRSSELRSVESGIRNPRAIARGC